MAFTQSEQLSAAFVQSEYIPVMRFAPLPKEALSPATKNQNRFELGIVTGGATTNSISSLASSAGDNFSSVPRANLLAAASFGSSFVLEALVLPPVSISNIKMNSESLGVKWLASEFFAAPVDISFKAMLGLTHFE